jgi:hypothetical protein
MLFQLSAYTAVAIFRMNEVEVKFPLRPTVSRSVCLGVEPLLGLMTRCLLLFDNYVLLKSGAPSDVGTGLSLVIVLVSLLSIYN